MAATATAPRTRTTRTAPQDPPAPRAGEGMEIWETTTAGRVWVTVTERGKERETSVGGKVGAKLRISEDDRQVNQDRCYEPSGDPFINGLLRRVDAGATPDDNSEHALDERQLMVGFAKSGKAFHAYVDKLNELNTRRMRDLCERVDASQSQVAYLDKVIKERYRIEGDTETYRELKRLERAEVL